MRGVCAYILSPKYWVLQGWASFLTLCSAGQCQERSSAVEPVKGQTKVHRRRASPTWQAQRYAQKWICKSDYQRHLYGALFGSLSYHLSRSMSANRRKKSSPSKSALATSQPTQQLSPPQLLPSTPESQSHSSQQQQQAQPNHPWSVLRPTSRSKGVLSSTSRPPFHRYGHTLSITAAGELLFFGGVAHDSLRNDLYVFSMRDRSVTFFQTSGEVPSPRSFSASVLVSNVLLIFGGTTNMDNRGFSTGPFDDSLYLLSLGTLNLLMLRPNLAD